MSKYFKIENFGKYPIGDLGPTYINIDYITAIVKEKISKSLDYEVYSVHMVCGKNFKMLNTDYERLIDRI